jgi:hypothetical protein
MVVRRIGPLSLAKVAGALYGLMGLLLGACISLISVLSGVFARGGGTDSPFGPLVGAGAIVVLPIFYGVLGFLLSLLAAALYNLIASSVGGIELDLQ